MHQLHVRDGRAVAHQSFRERGDVIGDLRNDFALRSSPGAPATGTIVGISFPPGAAFRTAAIASPSGDGIPVRAIGGFRPALPHNGSSAARARDKSVHRRGRWRSESGRTEPGRPARRGFACLLDDAPGFVLRHSEVFPEVCHDAGPILAVAGDAVLGERIDHPQRHGQAPFLESEPVGCGPGRGEKPREYGETDNDQGEYAHGVQNRCFGVTSLTRWAR